MIKKFILVSVAALTVAGCKKDSKTLLLNVTGTWKMTAFDQGQVSTNASQYPCIQNSLITINADGIATGAYMGSSPCVLSNVGGNTGVVVTLGQPGQPSTTLNWVRNGNNFTFKQTTQGSAQRFYATLSNVNNQLTMHITDTIKVGGNTMIEHETRVKQ
ncbi:MAG TPA: lipocalin family protein [Mucilaginibacter sp.]|nr:lipocalin family protein [Mucilaginibacter sp.]